MYSPVTSDMLALEKIQKAFEGETERLGLETEEDVDIFITGDKDFEDVDIYKPEIISATEFLEKNY